MDQKRKLRDFAFPKTEENKEAISECINKIMNTLSFRKLAGKTQVILSLSGPDVRTRLTHTIEVARIAKNICLKLQLNADLAEAIALAHDIGHTPFGHVGERTLREIMCGCDTLEGHVNDHDFKNSGFKHNLQSIRVLNDLEGLPEKDKGNARNAKVWRFILYGAAAHTNMTWSKPISGIDDEIYISSNHCDCVYSCYFHEKVECKYNLMERKKELSGKEICKPWYCANLPVVERKDQLREYDVRRGASKEDYIQNQSILGDYVVDIFCKKKCYLAKLWEHKIKDSATYKKYNYLYDHPFPNSFYANGLSRYFFSTSKSSSGWISLEALIVSQADEIAQRQQDLEDGVTKGLISLEEAKKEVRKLYNNLKDYSEFKVNQKDWKNITTSEKLGELIVNFYSSLLQKSTEENFYYFAHNIKKERIDLYCLLGIIYSFSNKEWKWPKWMFKELENQNSQKHDKIVTSKHFLGRLFKINADPSCLLFLAYDYLDTCYKNGEYWKKKINNKILMKLIEHFGLKEDFVRFKTLAVCNLDEIAFLKTMSIIKEKLRTENETLNNNFFINKDKQIWKTKHLKLKQFHSVHEFYRWLGGNKIGNICVEDIIKILANGPIKLPRYKAGDNFKVWRKALKKEANQIIGNYVGFILNNGSYKKNKDALKKFKGKTSNTILNSEIVEKNDGKASYMLKRMFKAYVSNSHQLPDLGLKYILTSIQKKEVWSSLKNNEEITFKKILQKLIKTMPGESDARDLIEECMRFCLSDKEFDELIKNKSNEIRSALEDRRNLLMFFSELERKKRTIRQRLFSEKAVEKEYINQILRNFRTHLDNSVLKATPQWKSILSRGICDYIASLTDQEAVNEYEKLYAGVMELV